MSLQSKPTTQPSADFRQRLARLQRVQAFTNEHVRALRREFAVFWRAQALETTLSGLQEPIIPFIRLLNDLALMVANAEATLQTIHTMPPQKAEAALETFDQDAMVTAAKQLSAMAQQLRLKPSVREALLLHSPTFPRPAARVEVSVTPAVPQAAAAPAAPVDAHGAAQPPSAAAPADPVALANANRLKLEHLQMWQPSPPVLAVEPQALPPATSTLSVEFARKVKAFLNSVDLAMKVLGNLSLRIDLLTEALRRTGVPDAPRPWMDVGADIRADAKDRKLSPLQMHWLPRLGHLFLNDREAVRVSQQAVAQWHIANHRLETALVQRDIVLATPPDRLPTVVQGLVPDNRLKNALSHLSCLPLHVKIIPVLAGLFPEMQPLERPAAVAGLSQGPGSL